MIMIMEKMMIKIKIIIRLKKIIKIKILTVYKLHELKIRRIPIKKENIR